MMRDQQDIRSNAVVTSINELRGSEPVATAGARRRASEQLSADTCAAYDLVVAQLVARGAGRVADLGVGTERLRAAGLEAARLAGLVELAQVEGVAGGAFERVLGEATLGAFDTLVLLDAIGRVDDDAALLRALARRASSSARLIAAAPVAAEVGEQVAAPYWRGYSPEQLDAVLVRAGWTAPVCVGRVGALLVFECARASDLAASRAIEAAEAPAADRDDLATVLARLADAARDADAPSEARELLLAIGALRLGRGDLDAAEEAFASANAIAPSCARPLVALARVALARGARDDAEALLDHALGFDAASAEAWTALAGLHAERGDTDAARECLECAAAVAPSDATVATELARVRAASGDALGAAEALERVMGFGRAPRAVQDSYCWLVTSAAHRGSALAFGRASTAPARLAS